MPPTSPAADAVARRLLAEALATSDASEGQSRDPVAAASRVLARLGDALARWFGPYGYFAVLSRALAQARVDHPALAEVVVRGPASAVLEGLPEAAHAHGAHATLEGITNVLAGVVDLLGRVIGEDLAPQLVERSMDHVVPGLSDPSLARGVPTGGGAS